MFSAYGLTGPDSHRDGFRQITEVESSVVVIVGNSGEAPPLLRVSLIDMYTGIHGVASICASLLGRTLQKRLT